MLALAILFFRLAAFNDSRSSSKFSRKVQLFHDINTGGFLLFPLESRKYHTSGLPITVCTPRATPTAVGIREEEYIQSIKNKEEVIKLIMIGQRVLESSIWKFLSS